MRTVQSSVLSDPEALLALHDLTEADLALIRKFGQIIQPKLKEYVTHFYGWLQTTSAYDQFFHAPLKLARVQDQQLNYWRSIF